MNSQTSILDWLHNEYDIDKKQTNSNNLDNHQKETKNIAPKFFNIDEFINNLKNSSIKSKFDRFIFSDNINAYDIAQNCINQVLYRLYNTPVPSYEDVWLPVFMRGVIGTAIHDFIQSNFDFTETEVVVKIDDFKFSGRIDAIINNNVLVEIKSVSINDYKKIINQNKPRDKDLYQTLIYRYLLMNHLDKILETKSRIEQEQPDSSYNWPKQPSYNIQYIQFIYIAHDLISSDITSIDEALYIQKEVKKKLNSRYNKFYFIKDIIINIADNPDYYSQIEHNLFNKLNEILTLFDKHQLADSNNPYIDTKQCFFCLYKNICPTGTK